MLALHVTSFERRASMLCKGAWELIMSHEAREQWRSPTFSALLEEGAGVGFGPVVAGEARLGAEGAWRPRPSGAADYFQHFMWHFPDDDAWRCFMYMCRLWQARRWRSRLRGCASLRLCRLHGWASPLGGAPTSMACRAALMGSCSTRRPGVWLLRLTLIGGSECLCMPASGGGSW